MFGKAQFEHRKNLEKPFTGSNFSSDGQYVIGDRGEVERCGDCDETLPVPVGVPETYPVTYIDIEDTGRINAEGELIYWPVNRVEQEPLTDNHPHYTHEQAKYLVGLEAWAAHNDDGSAV